MSIQFSSDPCKDFAVTLLKELAHLRRYAKSLCVMVCAQTDKQDDCKVSRKACAEEKPLWFSYRDSQRSKRIERIQADQVSLSELHPPGIYAYLLSVRASSGQHSNNFDWHYDFARTLDGQELYYHPLGLTIIFRCPGWRKFF